MDVNNTPYFLYRTAAEFEHASTRLQWHPRLRALTLAQNQSLRLPEVDPAAALATRETAAPLALDNFRQLGRLSSDATLVEFNSGRGFLPLKDGELATVRAPAGTFQDMHLTAPGLLALPYSDGGEDHGLLLFHLGRRWQAHCSLPHPARRVWVDSDDRIWCTSASQLMLCQGKPLPLPYRGQDTRFEPLTVNPAALALVWQQTLPDGLSALAICGDNQQLYLLTHGAGHQQTILTRPLVEYPQQGWRQHPLNPEIPFAIDLALAGPGRLAALAPRQAGDDRFVQRDCPVLELHWNATSETGEARLVQERYPMLSLAVARFVTSADGQLRYQAEADPSAPQADPRPRELHPLHLARYFTETRALLSRILDSGHPDTLWHRAYLDACIPSGCSITLSARVYDNPDQRTSAPLLEQPLPVWNSLPSELPFRAALAGHEPNRRGLFELLLQAPAGAVRQLRGRYLQLQLHFRGTGRLSPALHALRVYHPRFSYQEHYLPELFRQEQSRQAGVAVGPANGADVRERLLASFEGLLTPLEGRIAASEQLVHPDAAPREQLPWLAEALGAELPVHWPEPRQRRWLKHVTLIQQYRGTLAAVNLALDIACDGAVGRGEVVLVENFRLRRTMATILGRQMDDSDHPLTLGTGMSGNSIIGDSLILSDISAREFLALFAPELANQEETEAVQAFFDRYAHQVSVVLNGPGIGLRKRVDEILLQQMPAHLQWRFVESERPFVLGTAPLLAVDTLIDNRPEHKPVELDNTWIGREGVLRNPTAFSPRDVNARA